MPLLGAVVLLIQFCFAYHALKTGRPYWWIFVIMAFPVIGCVIYYFVEVFPRTRESAKAERAINKAVSSLSRAIDPEKELRQRTAEALLRENAGFKDGDVRLLLARALEKSGDVNAAEGAYADAVRAFRGEEARYCYGAMLKSLGQIERANLLFREVIKNAERSPRFYQDAQSDWVKAAKRDLVG